MSIPPIPLDTPVQDLGLSARAANRLRSAGINTLQDMLSRREDVKRLHMLVPQTGKKTQDEVDRAMPRLERLAGPNGLAAMVMGS